MILEVGNKVGTVTNRTNTSHPRYNFSFPWLGNEKFG
jgi:hypothetical protein